MSPGAGLFTQSPAEPTAPDLRPEALQLTLLCHTVQRRLQSVADLLLLTSDVRPVFPAPAQGEEEEEELRRCRDTVTSCARGLYIVARDVAALLQTGASRLQQLEEVLQQMAQLGVSLTEHCAQVGYRRAVGGRHCRPEQPGPVHRYQLCREAAEVELRCDLLKLFPQKKMSPPLLQELSSSISDHTTALTEACLQASERITSTTTRTLFHSSCRAVRASLATFTASMAAAAADTSCSLHSCQLFSESLLASCNALTVFATSDGTLTGSPARLTEAARDGLHDLFSACMNVVSPCVLVCALVRQAVAEPERRAASTRARVQQCQATIMKASVHLSQALGIPGYDM